MMPFFLASILPQFKSFTSYYMKADPPNRLEQALDRLAEGDKVSAVVLATSHVIAGLKSSSLATTPRVHVSGLPYEMEDQQLMSIFAQCGTSLSVEVPRRDSGRTKGFAFIRFDSVQAAQNAIDRMNGAKWGGQTLSVSPAKV